MREANLPFRSAHHIVSQLVQRLHGEGLDADAISPQLLAEISGDVLGQPLQINPKTLKTALDPIEFVNARNSLGGAAGSATSTLLTTQARQVEADIEWLQSTKGYIATAASHLEEKVNGLTGE